jgi:hypothetical protein
MFVVSFIDVDKWQPHIHLHCYPFSPFVNFVATLLLLFMRWLCTWKHFTSFFIIVSLILHFVVMNHCLHIFTKNCCFCELSICCCKLPLQRIVAFVNNKLKHWNLELQTWWILWTLFLNFANGKRQYEDCFFMALNTRPLEMERSTQPMFWCLVKFAPSPLYFASWIYFKIFLVFTLQKNTLLSKLLLLLLIIHCVVKGV